MSGAPGHRPVGPPGGDATVTCKVAFEGSASAVSQKATLSRRGRIYAKASRSGPGPIRFHTARLSKGRYLIRDRVWDRGGNLTINESRLRIR